MTKDEAPTYFTDKHAQSMTLRDHFAGLAMQALIDNEVVFADVPPEAYRMADAMLKIREALAQPEPVLNIYTSEKEMLKAQRQPKREWVGLTEDEVGDLFDFAYANDREFVLNVEAKLKEKNT